MLRRMIALVLACLLLCGMLLPVAAKEPSDPYVVAAQAALSEALGKDTAGAAIVILTDGGLSMLEGFGYADVGNGETGSHTLVTPLTVFEIGRLSGIFVAIAAFRLADEGRLDLDADISNYLSKDFMTGLKLKSKVSMRQLLCGTAGFEGRTFDLIFKKDGLCFDSLEEALLAEVPMQKNLAGEYYSYSEFGIALAAYVLEKITGMGYDAYVKDAVLSPLGMQNTYLFADADVSIEHLAKGHVSEEEGVFRVADGDGRRYFGLYPANGALSNAADMATLLQFLLHGNEALLSTAAREAMLTSVAKSGIFDVSAPALTVKGKALGVETATGFFSASLWLNREAGIGALVLCNTAKSALLAFPQTLCGASLGTPISEGGELPALDEFEGAYVTAASEKNSIVGRLWRKDHAEQAEMSEDGTLSFLGMRLYQIAPGIFADADKQDGIAVVQFVTDAEGEVTAVVTAMGGTYHPLEFYEQGMVATVLFYLLLAFAAWFFFSGPVSFLRWRSRRNDHESSEGFRHVLPDLFAMIISTVVLLQLLVAIRWGGASLASFFEAMTVLLLLVGIGALIFYTFAIVTSLTDKKTFNRQIRTAILFVLYVLLIVFWGFVPV